MKKNVTYFDIDRAIRNCQLYGKDLLAESETEYQQEVAAYQKAKKENDKLIFRQKIEKELLKNKRHSNKYS